MINRINLILKAKNITAKQFAEEIGIQPSGMSHIMGGRNNPSLEFVSKVIRRYPEIDANWLLLGKGEMYGNLERGEQKMESGGFRMNNDAPTLFSEPLQEPAPLLPPAVAPQPVLQPEPETVPQPEPEPVLQEYTRVEPEQEVIAQKEKPAPVDNKGHRLVKILFCYDDRTFEEYFPQ